MDLLERYLAAVARDLPEKQRADVVAELRDSLLSMIEDAEARLGRAQTRPELEAMLVAFGHPLMVAGRYRKTQYLIGPEVFPFWWAWLRATLGIVTAIYLVLAVVELFTTGEVSHALRGRDLSLVGALTCTFGAVTLIAAVVERWGKPQLLTRWKPRELPPAGGKPPTQFELAVELAMSLVFVAWWVGLIQFRNWMPDGLEFHLGPGWTVWFWPILGYGVFEAVIALLALLKPGRLGLIRGLRVLRKLTGAAILAGVLQGGQFVEMIRGPWEMTPERMANLDKGFTVGISITILGLLAGAIGDAWRLWRYRQATRALAGAV